MGRIQCESPLSAQHRQAPGPPQVASFRGRTLCLDLSELDVCAGGWGVIRKTEILASLWKGADLALDIQRPHLNARKFLPLFPSLSHKYVMCHLRSQTFLGASLPSSPASELDPTWETVDTCGCLRGKITPSPAHSLQNSYT